MRKKMHIIIAGESGRTRAFRLSIGSLKFTAGLTCFLLTLLVCTSVFSISLYSRKAELAAKVVDLSKEVRTATNATDILASQVESLEQEKELLLQDALEDLNHKSRLIESILSTVGVEIKVDESKRNSGGPFTAFSNKETEDLIFKVEQYLETIQTVPLGAPVPGTITSQYGRRKDPVNSRSAFHEGVDIRGRLGSDVKATADGRVVKVGADPGYGRFVVLEHANGFRTMLGHLQKTLVKEGQEVKRGDVVGLLGNSGRSTGPHVHYEIHYKDKLVDPVKFMRVARYLTQKKTS